MVTTEGGRPAGRLAGRRVAFLVAQDELELADLPSPWLAVMAAGGRPELVAFMDVAPPDGPADPADRARHLVPKTNAAHADSDRYDALVVASCAGRPGRHWQNDDASRLVGAFLDQGKPVAVVCCGTWTLIETGVLPARVGPGVARGVLPAGPGLGGRGLRGWRRPARRVLPGLVAAIAEPPQTAAAFLGPTRILAPAMAQHTV